MLRDGYRLAYDAEGRRTDGGTPAPFASLAYPRLQLRPYDVEHEGEAGQSRSLTSLAREAARAPELPGLRLELHGRLAHAFAHLALLLAGLPLVLRRESRSVVLGPLLGGGCCAAYFGLQAVAVDIGTRGLVAPALAAWAPVACLVAIGLAWWDTLPT